MDLKVIKEKLENLNKQAKKGSSGDNQDWKKNFFTPPIGKQTIRIVPSKFDKSNPFKEFYMYYGIGKNVMASPLNWDKKDPIVEFTRKLRKGSTSEDWRLAKKLDPKTRYFVPVIVRGEEDKGVRLWQFGKELYQDFLNLAIDDEIGDYTDVMQGRDIKLTTVGPEVTGTKFNKTSINVSLKITPLANSEEEIQNYLENQPNILDIYTCYEFDEIKNNLQEWLNEELEPKDSDGEEGESSDKVSYTERYNQPTPPNKKTSSVNKFESMFESETESETESDDLPF